jgi:hypothetical protein
MCGDRGKTHPPNPETRHKGLSSSPDFHELIGLFRVLHLSQKLLRLAMDTLYQLLIAIGHPVTLQDCFSEPAQDPSFDGAKPQPVDQQSSGFPDNFVLEEELCWLEGMAGKVRFQLEERMKPFAVAGKDRRSFMQDGEGRFLLCRHGFEFPIIAQHTLSDTTYPTSSFPESGLRFYLDTVTCDGGFELRFLPCIRCTDGRRIDFIDKGPITITP